MTISADDMMFDPALTIFMLVKTSPEWLGFSVDRRFALLREQFTPILEKHAANVRLRFFDVEFYATRVTDIWMWDARSHHGYELLVEDLRETAFWDRYFHIVEILTGVENAYARNYDRAVITV
ncbi:darcynin family protein [Sphingobium cyanobacteriorum]|nr:darcynin family protein [Sphingobium sp. HBC34]